MYVRQLMLLNDGPVTITTMKLNVQLLAVENAFAGALIRSPTISAGCSTHPPISNAPKTHRGSHARRATSCRATRRQRTS